jgi:hypothetical protein
MLRIAAASAIELVSGTAAALLFALQKWPAGFAKRRRCSGHPIFGHSTNTTSLVSKAASGTVG